jgi:hypothetical protein
MTIKSLISFKLTIFGHILRKKSYKNRLKSVIKNVKLTIIFIEKIKNFS